MSYYLYDVDGYVADGPSIGGLEQLAEWAKGKPALDAFLDEGQTTDLEALAEALRAEAPGSVDSTRLAMLAAVSRAKDILILSDGVEGDGEPHTAAARLAPETLVHKAADAHLEKVSIAIRYAFARGRKAINRKKLQEALRSQSKIEALLTPAIDAVRAALEEVLPRTLLKVFAAGGEAGFALLKKQLRAAGGPGSGNYGHSGGEGGPGNPGGSGGGGSNPLFGETPGAHSKAAAERLVSYLEKETGMKLSLHGSLGKGAASSPNDIDIAVVDPTYKMTPDERKAWESEEIRKGNEAEDEIWARKQRGEISYDEAMEQIYGEGKNAFEEALDKIGFKPVRVMDWEGVSVVRFRNEETDHTIEIWDSSDDQGDAESGPPTPSGRDLEAKWVLRAARRLPLVKKVGVATIRFDATNQRAADWADRHAAELIDGITETTREEISNAIAEAFETGDLASSYEAILEAVGDEQRAELIARTETMMAANAGQREGWAQAADEGLLTGRERREWIATGDDGVCVICEELNGQLADLDGEYPEPGGEGPPAHPRCRCTEGISIG